VAKGTKKKHFVNALINAQSLLILSLQYNALLKAEHRLVGYISKIDYTP